MKQIDKTANDHTEAALLAAANNYRLLKQVWCKCAKQDDIAYYRSPHGSDHGWMCCVCLCVVQTG